MLIKATALRVCYTQNITLYDGCFPRCLSCVQWAEIVGLRLEELIATEKQNYALIDQSLADPERQKELQLQDEEEDFLDEGECHLRTNATLILHTRRQLKSFLFFKKTRTACVNPHGNDCPPALKLVACVLLYEITAFLRETYQTLPKASKASAKEKPAPWEKVYRYVSERLK